MNIFVLDQDPRIAARSLCDKHINKMLLESAQLLCGTFPQGVAPYRRTHHQHPCAIWTRTTTENWQWLVDHALELSEEFALRYDKRHASEQVVHWCMANHRQAQVPHGGLSAFAQAMPEQYKQADAVQAYRAYYQGEKARFAAWEKGRAAPEWWVKV